MINYLICLAVTRLKNGLTNIEFEDIESWIVRSVYAVLMLILAFL
jgi:hypothetical protein